MTQQNEALPEAAENWIGEHFADETKTAILAPSDEPRIKEILKYVDLHIAEKKTYVLGLAVDFAVLAERLAEADPEALDARPTITELEIFARYKLVEKVGSKIANTLSLAFDGAKKKGIRRTEEELVTLFHGLGRSSYPSAYVYNTGQWQKYKDLLVLTFGLSPAGRRLVVSELLKLALMRLPENAYYGRQTPRARLFGQVISGYPRSDDNENAGLTFQAIAFGFVSADRPHLQILASSVRVGSARQRRIGDIDGYRGLDLELSAEVKDIHITAGNYDKQLSGFVTAIEDVGILGLAILQAADDDVRERLRGANIEVITDGDLGYLESMWDWPKQNAALLGMMHYLAHIEQNPAAVQRLVDFVGERDPAHEVLAYVTTQS